MTPPGSHHLCWITDYFAAECRERACTHSPNPPHPCLPAGEEQPDGQVGDVV
jgi:hypothetical protein